MEALQTFAIQCMVWVREFCKDCRVVQCSFDWIEQWCWRDWDCKVSDSAEIFLRSRTTGHHGVTVEAAAVLWKFMTEATCPNVTPCPAGSRRVTVRGLKRVILIMQPHSRNGDQMAAFIPWRAFRPQWYLCLSSAQCAPPLAINTTQWRDPQLQLLSAQ